MTTNLDEHVRTHPITILGGCVLLGIALTGGAIGFLTHQFGFKLVAAHSVVSVDEVKRDYVTKDDYNRVSDFVQIILNQEKKTKYEEIAALVQGFKILIDNLNKESQTFLRPDHILAYNFYATRFNNILPDSPLPIFPDTKESQYGGEAVLSAMMLAVAIIEGNYFCTVRN